MLPHPDTLVELVYAKARKAYTSKVKFFLSNTRHIKDDDMTIEVCLDLYTDAAELVDAEHSSLNAALRDQPPPDQPADSSTKKKRVKDSKTPAEKLGGSQPAQTPQGAPATTPPSSISATASARGARHANTQRARPAHRSAALPRGGPCGSSPPCAA